MWYALGTAPNANWNPPFTCGIGIGGSGGGGGGGSGGRIWNTDPDLWNAAAYTWN